MSRQVIISYAQEDLAIAESLAQGLENAGYTVWYYGRDGVVGPRHLDQTTQVIQAASAVILVISKHSLKAHQVESEVIFAHERNKPFAPVLVGLTYTEFERLKPSWIRYIRAASAARIASAADVSGIMPKIAGGLDMLGILPQTQQGEGARSAPSGPTPPGADKAGLTRTDTEPGHKSALGWLRGLAHRVYRLVRRGVPRASSWKRASVLLACVILMGLAFVLVRGSLRTGSARDTRPITRPTTAEQPSKPHRHEPVAGESYRPEAVGFHWVVTKGFETSVGNGYGRALYAVRPDGTGGLLPLYEPKGLPQNKVLWYPQFKGDLLVFHAGAPWSPDRGDIYVGRVGSDVVQPIGSPSGYRDRPAGAIRWVPGRDEVLFSNDGTGISIMDLNPATNDERVLTDNYFDEIEGVRSDTGTVVFTNAMYRPGSRIYLMNLDGSYIRPLNPFHDGTFARCPVLSPNNSLLIVTRTEKKGIWLVRARTGELLTHENSPLVSGIRDYGDNAGWAAWSPDSTTIAYIDTRTNQLCSIKWDGTAKRKLTSGPFASLRVWGTYVGRLGKASRGVSGG